jgi:hypothetical protein
MTYVTDCRSLNSLLVRRRRREQRDRHHLVFRLSAMMLTKVQQRKVSLVAGRKSDPLAGRRARRTLGGEVLAA